MHTCSLRYSQLKNFSHITGLGDKDDAEAVDTVKVTALSVRYNAAITVDVGAHATHFLYQRLHHGLHPCRLLSQRLNIAVASQEITE